jgi:hypothetical protein
MTGHALKVRISRGASGMPPSGIAGLKFAVDAVALGWRAVSMLQAPAFVIYHLCSSLPTAVSKCRLHLSTLMRYGIAAQSSSACCHPGSSIRAQAAQLRDWSRYEVVQTQQPA